jgi:hypothetical protein
MARELALVLAALVILATAIGIATAYPSHAYRTATPTSTAHTYCRTVGSFEAVSAPTRVERWWGLRAGSLGAGLALSLGLLTTAKVSHSRRTDPTTSAVTHC